MRHIPTTRENVAKAINLCVSDPSLLSRSALEKELVKVQKISYASAKYAVSRALYWFPKLLSPVDSED